MSESRSHNRNHPLQCTTRCYYYQHYRRQVNFQSLHRNIDKHYAIIKMKVIRLGLLSGIHLTIFLQTIDGFSTPIRQRQNPILTVTTTRQQYHLRSNRIVLHLSNNEIDSYSSSPNIVVDHVPCNIQVIGVGGGGGNAVNHMIQQNDDKLLGVSFYAINTDAQALSRSSVPNVVNIGKSLTRGLGAGGNPMIGREAALENALELKKMMQGSDLVFITAGMGGGTGSGAAPVIAEIAKNDCGCLTVGIVTKPFAFEGRRRMKQAEEAIEQLRQRVDTLIVVSNDKLLELVSEDTPMTEAFVVADDILRQGVVGISEIILRTGLVNVDFADVRTVMKDAGAALMGIGIGQGPNRAIDAANAAITSPLLESPIQNAKRVVFNICGSSNLRLSEINAASEVIYKNCDPNANIIFGALIDPTMNDTVSITVLACDFDELNSSTSLPTARTAITPTQLPTPKVDQDREADNNVIQSEIQERPNGNLPTTSSTTPFNNQATIQPPRVLPKRGFSDPIDPNRRSSLFPRIKLGQ
jgi:cell division protein FtsZ